MASDRGSRVMREYHPVCRRIPMFDDVPARSAQSPTQANTCEPVWERPTGVETHRPLGPAPQITHANPSAAAADNPGQIFSPVTPCSVISHSVTAESSPPPMSRGAWLSVELAILGTRDERGPPAGADREQRAGRAELGVANAHPSGDGGRDFDACVLCL